MVATLLAIVIILQLVDIWFHDQTQSMIALLLEKEERM